MNRFRRSEERKSIRLRGWDYRMPAWCFITICTKNGQHFFGEIRNGIMGLSETGLIAHHYWADIPDHFDHIKLDAYVVMPNHVHGLIGIMERPVGDKTSQDDDNRQNRQFGPLKSGSISSIMQAYKSSVTRWARKNNHHNFAWQPRFHDHIIRNEKAFNNIQDYIINNPLGW